jgi:hypothetical protein
METPLQAVRSLVSGTRLTSKTGDGYRQFEFLVEFLAIT